jgi:hypothetical protein
MPQDYLCHDRILRPVNAEIKIHEARRGKPVHPLDDVFTLTYAAEGGCPFSSRSFMR